MKDEKYHQPVLVKEVVENLAPLENARIIDATLGTGGHSLALIEAGAVVLGIEADPEMLEISRKRLVDAKLVHANFREIDKIAKENGFNQIDGILFDLGVTNLQLTSTKRGFSFVDEAAELDMRVNPSEQGVTGADLLNGLRQDQLQDLFFEVMDFSGSRWLVKRVIEQRSEEPIKTVGDFLAICRSLRTKPGFNPATLPFLALRMAVNSEVENLKEALPKAFELLKAGGKLLVISFHSKEEKIVLDFFKDLERKGKAKVEGPIVPDAEEKDLNPRSRSAELFVLTKTPSGVKK